MSAACVAWPLRRMASKNIFSDGYTQLPVLGSAPVSVSWFTGHAEVVAPEVVERGIDEMTRSVPRGDEEERGCCCGWVAEGFDDDDAVDEEEEEKKGIRGQPQPLLEDEEEGGDCCCCHSVDVVVGCDDDGDCAALACANHTSLLL